MFVMLGALMVQAGWQVSEAKDPITDRINVTASIRGDNASIVFRCAAGEKPSLIYLSDEFLGGGGIRYQLRDFVFRFDSGQPKRESWKYLDGYAQPYSTKASVAFVAGIIQSNRLAVRAERYDGRRIESIFDLAGAPQAFHRAFEACGIR